MTKKKCPFRRGQRVKCKGSKRCGTVLSNDWYTIGDPTYTKIPGGPLVIEGYVAVQFAIKGKQFKCMESVDNLELC